jgi:hypothetical protein
MKTDRRGHPGSPESLAEWREQLYRVRDEILGVLWSYDMTTPWNELRELEPYKKRYCSDRRAEREVGQECEQVLWADKGWYVQTGEYCCADSMVRLAAITDFCLLNWCAGAFAQRFRASCRLHDCTDVFEAAWEAHRRRLCSDDRNLAALDLLEQQLRGITKHPSDSMCYTVKVNELKLLASNGQEVSFRTCNAWRLLLELVRHPNRLLEHIPLTERAGSDDPNFTKKTKYLLGQQLVSADFHDLWDRIISDRAGVKLDIPPDRLNVVED